MPSVSARTLVQRVQLRLLQRITVFCRVTLRLSSRSPRWISRFWICAFSAETDCSLVCRGPHLIEVGLRDVLHRTQALVAIERDLIVTRGVLRGAQVGAGGGDLRVQLLVAQFRLLEGDLRRFNFINEWRWVELIQQVALSRLLLCARRRARHSRRPATKPGSPRA